MERPLHKRKLPLQFILVINISIVMKINESNEYFAIGLISMSQVLFPASYIYVTEHNFSMADFNLIRGIVLLIICLVTARLKQVNLQRSIRANFMDFLIRNVAVLIHMYCILLSHYYLSISVVHTINSLGTIFVFMWDYYLYGITINRKQSLGICLGIIGMLLTVNSVQIYLKFNSDFESGSTFDNYHFNSLSQSVLMGVLLVLANVVWAYSASLIKTVKMKDSCEMNYHLAIIIIISTGIHYSLFGIELKSLDLYVGAIFYSAIPIGIGQVLFVTSLTLSRNTGTLTLFVSVSIIVGYCFSLIRYHENLNPIAVIGSLMIISGLAIVVLCKEKIENRIQKL